MSEASEISSTVSYESAYADGFRHNWTKREILEYFNMPFMDLLFEAQTIHRTHFDPNRVQLSQLCSIKTGGCPEDCKYCPQSARYQTEVDASKLMAVQEVIEKAKKAKEAGATRYCMGAAWRSPKGRDMDAVVAMIEGVKDLGMETCVTLGMLDEEQVTRLKQAGLDYYNHNVDSSPEYYKEIITTRSYEDRLETLERVRGAGINVCSGGIVGMGESLEDRAGMLQTLANLPQHPGSVPINMLVQVEGTPLFGEGKMDPFDFVRTIAVARILMPASYVRLSAGREEMNDEMQALCFMAGANSIFYGEKLLTTPNSIQNRDTELFERLGINPEGK
ncbi:biotin synthase BioB [Emcibacter nanhaiensis]|uniref:Biotin synthase n=1 Tax=Emcibacter nanhaiensis TaxID=1505037 RepID=A0A501PKH2_9PROT|nr:biotin synthase BioB [Emcibacter nanhaiensis]